MTIDLRNIKINLYEPINGTLFTSLKGSNDAWKISSEGLKDIESIFPKPKELLYTVRNKCLKNTDCKFDLSTENNVKVKVLLKNV